MNIDFFTFIGPNSADYADYLKYTCKKFLSGKHTINWKCIESVGAINLPKGYDCVAKSGNAGHNSLNHGVAMNLALKYVKSEYVVFIDADMAIVHKNWDDIIVSELNKNDCFGVSYSDVVKYKNFPTVYLFTFRSYILDKADLDFTPRIMNDSGKPIRYIVNEDEAKFFNMKPGSILKCDTGWRLPLIIKRAGFTGKSMPMILMGSKEAQLPFESTEHRNFCMQKPEHMYEWHYNKKVFSTHKQASRTQSIDSPFGNAWKKRVDLYIRNNS